MKGFPYAINTAFPDTQIQLCIAPMVRNSMKYVPWRLQGAAGLKAIYQSTTEGEALLALETFCDKSDAKFRNQGKLVIEIIQPA
ncbi:hypothetical protein RJ45_09445 [Photobacterium gaetbulicola]|uniref:Mutator family transposase n=1 Tax=Photobacterium gaetbulicola TaxID=1295392 RepID=A0A0B9G594_9GAMM|nr:hypothetical protein RJ45_09445 [Photobacterium gaetbulicola]